MKSKLLKYNGIGALCSSTDCSWVEGPIYNLRDFYYKYRHGSLLGMHTLEPLEEWRRRQVVVEVVVIVA